MKKLISTILTLMMLTSLLSSCGLIKGPISDEQARDILTEMLPDVTVLNAVLWGEVATAEEVREEDARART